MGVAQPLSHRLVKMATKVLQRKELCKCLACAKLGDGMGLLLPLVQRKMSRLSEYDRLAGWLFRPLQFEPEALAALEENVKQSIQCIGGGLGRIEVIEE